MTSRAELRTHLQNELDGFALRGKWMLESKGDAQAFTDRAMQWRIWARDLGLWIEELRRDEKLPREIDRLITKLMLALAQLEGSILHLIVISGADETQELWWAELMSTRAIALLEMRPDIDAILT